MREFNYIITDSQGIHARPAGLLVKEAQKYKSEITLKKDSLLADAKKIFSIMKLAAKQNENITVTCSGEDENTAAEAMESFFMINL